MRQRCGNCVRRTVGEQRVLHTQGRKQAVAHDGCERLAAFEMFSDEAEQDCVGVRIAEFGSGWRESRRVLVAHRQQVGLCPCLGGLCIERLVQFARRRVIEQATSHREQLLDCDVRTIWNIGPVLRDGVTQAETALLNQLQDHCASPGLGVRADPHMLIDASGDRAAIRRDTVGASEVAGRRAQDHDRTGNEHVLRKALYRAFHRRRIGRAQRRSLGVWCGACRHEGGGRQSNQCPACDWARAIRTPIRAMRNLSFRHGVR